MSTIWNPPDWHQRQAAREEAKLKIEEYAAALASNPYVTQYKSPSMHSDWKLEWTAVDRLKVVNLLKAGVDVRWYSMKQGAMFDRSMPAMPLTYYGEAWAGLPDMTCDLILQNYGDDIRFVVRTE